MLYKYTWFLQGGRGGSLQVGVCLEYIECFTWVSIRVHSTLLNLVSDKKLGLPHGVIVFPIKCGFLELIVERLKRRCQVKRFSMIYPVHILTIFINLTFLPYVRCNVISDMSYTSWCEWQRGSIMIWPWFVRTSSRESSNAQTFHFYRVNLYVDIHLTSYSYKVIYFLQTYLIWHVLLQMLNVCH